jgi:beta-glucanase (GH16 family)
MNLLKYTQIFSLSVTLILFSNCGSNETDPTGMGIDEPTIDPMILDLDGDGITNDADTCDSTPSGALVDAFGCSFINEYDPNYFLVWQDEFLDEGAVDGTKWHHQIIAPNNGSWFNGEKQHYTDKITNSYVSDGVLIIKAIKESYEVDGSTQNYTSARLNSRFSFRYGRIDVRAKLPGSAGTWPAIWTLGTNINEIGNYFGSTYGNVGWPSCGEIDIMEQNGWDKTELIGHFHWGHTSTGEYASYGKTAIIEDAMDEFHIYSLEWTEGQLKVLLDNNVFLTMNNTASIPYDNPHYILLNIAMGGNLGGAIEADFSSDSMQVDYVRVYEME